MNEEHLSILLGALLGIHVVDKMQTFEMELSRGKRIEDIQPLSCIEKAES